MVTIQDEARISGRSEQAVREARDASAKTGAFEQAQLAVLEPDGRPTEIQYGSPEWTALPTSAPQRMAALIRAASAWRSYCDETAERVLSQTDSDIAVAEMAHEALRAEWDAEQAEEWKLIARWARGLASVPTTDEYRAVRAASRPREVRAAEGWPPVAVPGRPGWRRHLIDGRQVDLPLHDRAEVAA